MASQATGTFEVKVTPQAPVFGVGDPLVGRMAIDKRFSGDLEGASQGQMLALKTEVEGSAGYVAIERITGTLGGRRGAFALQHSGILDRGVPTLSVAVVPDSGTEGLVGLAGSMTIEALDGKHTYRFEYILPDIHSE